MKILKDILDQVAIKQLIGSDQQPISRLCLHSSEVIKNSLFVALSGYTTDGHHFIQEAIEKGANVIVCQKFPEKHREGLSYIQVDNCAEVLGLIAANFYDHPSKKLRLIGVTGTNGKTTSVSLLHELFLKFDEKSALLSTICLKIGSQCQQATHTMPNAISIQSFLHRAVKEGCNYAFMEISSHGIDQKRHAGLYFFGGIFSNITYEHLDYHKTFRNYLRAKKSFFDELPSTAFALVNTDDKNAQIILQNSRAKKYTYSLKNPADYQGKILEKSILGTLLRFDGREFWSQLTGVFNTYNLLAIYAGALLMGKEKEQVLKILSTLKPVKGRFEHFRSSLGIHIIVDYAHTPDALEKVLKTLRELREKNQRILCILGCGGDRDRKNRPYMTKIACKNANQVILTSDNPRSEDPEKILDEMEKDLSLEHRNKILRISDRKSAIKTAITLAKAEDMVLIAGKGHEIYQEIKGTRYPFDDMKIAQEIVHIKRSKLKNDLSSI
ncbi:UDP-N-acetylmuramoyl-L-alanyl-D-glutamate--2,6-diaminopimelate ligase [Bacteroidetes bacterium endosymbiont of Geopemphigus sp.]|uniref:UDP-N-acetylmuramoyl-L-alanyl-D-glutamate--2, 6-diaminopimelate ligase n=1 Tax=Bacteroidetes bacterium endosymbiont of Geopemphigus sp. TaxID=2047937 RepID=UPI000CD11E9B|nr:UDP-N-acetylmuramoyl-L-alanyl-D-glutamate--2,6-diaminopimelate ligase [Bacteroidetes bacterium endosymbiont of Geopemphigus sp.]